MLGAGHMIEQERPVEVNRQPTKIHQWSVTHYLYAVLGSTVTRNCPDCDVAAKFRPSLAPALVSDRSWELSGFLDGARLGRATPFVAGDKDAVIEFYDAYQTLESTRRTWRRRSCSAAPATGPSRSVQPR
jgi:hypothetical protein